MRAYVVLAVTWSLLSCAGCASWPGSGARPEPVAFNHPEEVIRGQGFMVLADRRVFAVMAFLNAVGLDEEYPGTQMHPVRIRVRQLVADNLASHREKVESWRRYYKANKLDFYYYQDFALSLSADYPFRRIHQDTDLGYVFPVAKFRNFAEILNDFWRTAHLDEVWRRVQPDYAAELRKYDFARMTQQMASLWKYLRMSRQDTLMLVNVPNLLDKHYRAIWARYGSHYYTVESPGSHSYGLNIHEYLHSIVNPIVKAHPRTVKTTVRQYYEAGKDKPIVEPYREPVAFTCECLVRALDHRLAVLQTGDPAEKKRIEGQVAWETEKGLTLTQPFYRLLEQYEESDQPFDRFFLTMLERLPSIPDHTGTE